MLFFKKRVATPPPHPIPCCKPGETESTSFKLYGGGARWHRWSCIRIWRVRSNTKCAMTFVHDCGFPFSLSSSCWHPTVSEVFGSCTVDWSMVGVQHLLWLSSPIIERQGLVQLLQVNMQTWVLQGAECSLCCLLSRRSSRLVSLLGSASSMQWKSLLFAYPSRNIGLNDKSQLSSFLSLDTQTTRWLHKRAISSLPLFIISLSASILSRTCFLFLCSTSVFFLSLWFCRCLSYFCRNEAAAASSFFVIGTLQTPSTFL